MKTNIFMLSEKEQEEIYQKSKEVRVNMLERLTVNLFTIPDLIFDYVIDRKKGSFTERAKRMWKGKNEDYKRFVVVYKKYGEIPSKVRNLLEYSPCGLAKLVALRIRNS